MGFTGAITVIDRHQRVRLVAFDVVPGPERRVTVQVSLAWTDSDRHDATAVGEDSPHGRLRAAAEATARALVLASVERVTLEVLAVKAIETFDTVLVVVSLSTTVDDISERLVGACLIRDRSPSRGAVLAVLDATNRLLGRVLAGT